MNVIGLDIGTTSICGILADSKSGRILRSLTQNSNAFIQTENEWEKIQDVSKILDLVTKTLDALLEGVSVCAIGLTGQMHGIVYLNEAGKTVSPLYTWQDARANLPFEGGKTYAEFVGVSAGYGMATDFYNIHNGLRPKSAVCCATIADYAAMVLAGLCAPVIHSSNAASVCGKEYVQNGSFFGAQAKIVRDAQIIGHYRGIPISAAIGDNQASVFGALCEEDAALLNIGTGSQISVIADNSCDDTQIETRPYIGEKNLLVGAGLCGGRAYAMLERFYSDVVYYATGRRMNLYEAMEKMPETGTLSADTRFAGTRKNPAQTGSITHITEENFTPGNLRKSIMTGMIQELKALYDCMGVSKATLVASGNGIRKNRALLPIVRECFGMDIKIPLHTEEAAFGAALFALSALGLQDVRELIRYEGEI